MRTARGIELLNVQCRVKKLSKAFRLDRGEWQLPASLYFSSPTVHDLNHLDSSSGKTQIDNGHHSKEFAIWARDKMDFPGFVNSQISQEFSMQARLPKSDGLQ